MSFVTGGEEQNYDVHGEDFVVSAAEIAADFICKDLYVL